MGIDYREILDKLRGFMGKFMYALFTKWYVLIAGAAITVTYLFFKGLMATGIIDAIYNDLSSILNIAITKAGECPQYILNFNLFMDCLGKGQ